MRNITGLLMQDVQTGLAGAREIVQPFIYIARGIYAPFALKSEFSRAKKEYETPMSQSDGLVSGFGLGLIEPLTAFSSTLIAGTLASEKGLFKEYIAALLVSNAIDYTLNLCKRAKEIT